MHVADQVQQLLVAVILRAVGDERHVLRRTARDDAAADERVVLAARQLGGRDARRTRRITRGVHELALARRRRRLRLLLRRQRCRSEQRRCREGVRRARTGHGEVPLPGSVNVPPPVITRYTCRFTMFGSDVKPIPRMMPVGCVRTNALSLLMRLVCWL